MGRDAGLSNEARKERAARYMREWYKKNPDRVGGYVRRAYYESRDALLKLLGDKCGRCGFADRRALQFDHINGDGHKERGSRNGGYGAKKLRDWLRDPEIKTKLQLLCANCNWIKRSENQELGVGNRNGRPKKYVN